MRADPDWQFALAIPHSQKQERTRAFAALREQYGFSEYALHTAGKRLRVSWLAEHIDAVLAQTLASRAYRSLNRVCLGQARRVRFRSHGRGLRSLENKRNDTGLRFVLQKPEDGNQGCLIWKDDHLPALIDWEGPVVKHGLDKRIKYARLIQRKASSPQAQGADAQGYRYCVQLALEGIAYHKAKHLVGQDTIGADLGPSTIALVPRVGEASLCVFCEELVSDEQGIRRLQRKMDRQRRVANPGNYDSRGRIRSAGAKKPLTWKQSKGYQKIRRCKAEKERKLAAHRVAACMVAKSMRLWPWGTRSSSKRFPIKAGRSVGRASTRDVCSTAQAHRGRVRAASSSKFLPGKPSSVSFATDADGTSKSRFPSGGTSAPVEWVPSSGICIRRFWLVPWIKIISFPRVPRRSFSPEDAEARLRAAHERVAQRAKEGQVLPRSFGIPRAGVRRPQSLSEPTQEPAFPLTQGKLEAWKDYSEPPVL
jgi:hypothetical protein